MKTLDEVKRLIAEQLNISEDKIKEDSNVIKDLGADSIDLVEMLMTLEEKFKISIPDGETENMQTVSSIIKLIEAGTNKRKN